MPMRDYEFVILDKAERGDLPAFVSDESVAPLARFKELLDAGLLHGQPLAGDQGLVQIAKPTITQKGRQRLAELREKQFAKTWRGRFRRWMPSIIAYFAGIGTTVIAKWLAKVLHLDK